MATHRPADWQLPAGVNRGLWDYLHDAGLARGYDASLADTPLFAADEAFVTKHCPPQGRLLDLGCGTGRLLVAMSARGHSVVGVDLSGEMLAVAGEKAEHSGVAVDRVLANITDLSCFADESFDCVACLFSTLGMVLGKDNRNRVLKEVFRLLRPGGRFVLHVHNRRFNVWNGPGRAWLLRDFANKLRGQETGDRVMPVHQGIAGLTLHLFTRSEIQRTLTESGFRILEVFPLSLRLDGRLNWPRWFSALRAYGYLLGSVKG